MPLSTVQAGGGFIAGVVSCSSREDEANAETEAEEGFKIVVVTQKRQLFRCMVLLFYGRGMHVLMTFSFVSLHQVCCAKKHGRVNSSSA